MLKVPWLEMVSQNKLNIFTNFPTMFLFLLRMGWGYVQRQSQGQSLEFGGILLPLTMTHLHHYIVGNGIQ